jgi:hypothetical protein
MEEDSASGREQLAWLHEGFGWREDKRRAQFGGLHLLAGLDDEDHARAQRGRISVVALEGGDGCFVGGCDRIKSLAGFDAVVKYGGWAGRTFGGL